MNNLLDFDARLTRSGTLLWPTVIAIPGLALLLGLGTWQLDRLAWKTALIADRESQLSAPAMVLDVSSDRVFVKEFRRVALRGIFLHEYEFHLLPRTFKGQAGLHVVTPFVPDAGGSNSHAVLINRGWVPNKLKNARSRPEGQVAGVVYVTGIARTADSNRGWFVPENKPIKGIWHRLDIEQMGQVAGLELASFVVEAGPDPNQGGYPIGGQTRIHLRNDHLGYAITWYTLAAVLALIYFLFLKQKLPRQSPETS